MSEKKKAKKKAAVPIDAVKAIAKSKLKAPAPHKGVGRVRGART